MRDALQGQNTFNDYHVFTVYDISSDFFQSYYLQELKEQIHNAPKSIILQVNQMVRKSLMNTISAILKDVTSENSIQGKEVSNNGGITKKEYRIEPFHSNALYNVCTQLSAMQIELLKTTNNMYTNTINAKVRSTLYHIVNYMDAHNIIIRKELKEAIQFPITFDEIIKFYENNKKAFAPPINSIRSKAIKDMPLANAVEQLNYSKQMEFTIKVVAITISQALAQSTRHQVTTTMFSIPTVMIFDTRKQILIVTNAYSTFVYHLYSTDVEMYINQKTSDTRNTNKVINMAIHYMRKATKVNNNYIEAKLATNEKNTLRLERFNRLLERTKLTSREFIQDYFNYPCIMTPQGTLLMCDNTYTVVTNGKSTMLHVLKGESNVLTNKQLKFVAHALEIPIEEVAVIVQCYSMAHDLRKKVK